MKSFAEFGENSAKLIVLWCGGTKMYLELRNSEWEEVCLAKVGTQWRFLSRVPAKQWIHEKYKDEFAAKQMWLRSSTRYGWEPHRKRRYKLTRAYSSKYQVALINLYVMYLNYRYKGETDVRIVFWSQDFDCQLCCKVKNTCTLSS